MSVIWQGIHGWSVAGPERADEYVETCGIHTYELGHTVRC
jgi:hypothetical protein